MDEQLVLPATLPPDSTQKRLALIVALLVPVPFIAIIPIGQIQLPRVDSYIPVVDTVMLINDSIAATLLLAQFSIVRLPSLLALAAGFLFTAFLIIPHALTFPGAFVPNGLLGAGLQTTAWLNEFWFLGLPSAVIAYALLKRASGEKLIPRGAIPLVILTTVMSVSVVTCTLVWLTTEWVEVLPAIMADTVQPQLAWHFLPVVVISIIAMRCASSSSECRADSPRTSARPRGPRTRPRLAGLDHRGAGATLHPLLNPEWVDSFRDAWCCC
jgi:hypothetical protein